MYFNMRERQILEILLKNQNVPIRIYDMAQHLAVSSRTIHRELKSLEKSLATLDTELIRQKNKGVFIKTSETGQKKLKHILNNDAPMDLTLEEQKVILLYALIQSSEPLKQWGLASEIGTSLQQLSKVLDALEKDLNQFNIQLERTRGVGIAIHGSEMHKRELLSQLMMERLDSLSVYSVIKNHFVFQSLTHERLPLMDMKEIFQIERVLMDDLDALPYTLTESSYLGLIVHIALSVERMKHKQFVSIDMSVMSDVQQTLEYEVAESIAERLSHIYSITLDEAETSFIAIHLQSAKRKHEKESAFVMGTTASIQQLVDAVEQSMQIEFSNRKELIEGLSLHIKPALNRIQYRIETHNPMTERIQSSYSLIFEAVTKAVKTIWPSITFPVHEIAFLVLHFGGAIQTIKQTKHVLVVCSSGVGTSRILANRLTESFPMIDEIKQASVSDLKTLPLETFDAIISTVELDIPEPYLTVNPLLPEHELAQTSAFLHDQFNTEMKKPVQYAHATSHTSQNVIRHKLEIMHYSLDIAENFESHTLKNGKSWEHQLANLLASKQVIKSNEVSAFAQLLIARHAKQSFDLSPYPIAIPHLIDERIERPFLAMVHLEKPVMMQHTEVYLLLCAFLPHPTHLRPLVSEIYSTFTHHLDDWQNAQPSHSTVEQLVQSEVFKFIQNL